MLRKLASILFATVVLLSAWMAPISAPYAQAQVYTIPCPTIPCPTFDGANFSKNTLTEMHNLQIMHDTILAKLYQYKSMLSSTDSLSHLTWQDIQEQLDELERLMHQDETLCAKMQYDNVYFVRKFPTSSVSETSPCNSANLAQAHDLLMSTKKTVLLSHQSRTLRNRNREVLKANLASAAGTKAAIQAAGAITADLGNEMQAQQALQESQINAEVRYFDSELARHAREDAENKASRIQGNYFKTGCYNDPQERPATPCQHTPPSPGP